MEARNHKYYCCLLTVIKIVKVCKVVSLADAVVNDVLYVMKCKAV